MPILVFRQQQPKGVLLAGLEKFKKASNINLGGAATNQVRASSALQGIHRHVVLDIRRNVVQVCGGKCCI